MVGAAWALYLALAVSAARTHSATFDESIYLPAGYTALQGDYRILTVHPPLPRMVAALPLLFMDVRFDGRDPAFLEPHGWKFGHRFLYLWNDADRLLIAGRAAAASFTLLLAAGIYSWTRRRWGASAAGFALVLAVFSPDLLAHGPLVTSDLPVACFFFLTVASFERLLEGPSAARVAVTGGALGAALLSKHSALLLGALLPLLILVHAAGEREGRRRRLGRGAGRLVLAALVAYAVLWAGYRCRFDAAADPAAVAPMVWRAAPEPGLLSRGVRFAADHHLVPEAYAHCIADLQSRHHSRRAFLLGAHGNEGWWYYFPVAFALKTPLPLLVLLLAAPFVVRGPAAPFVWIPAVAFALFAMTTSVNIGVRYLLPLLPFLIVAAGCTAAALASRGRWGRVIVGTLLMWYAGGTLRHHPHHLSFFNEIAGGPYGGYRYLADSNVDWGQDLKRLAHWVQEQKVPRLRLSYFGTAPPAYYDLPHDLLPSVMRPFPERFLVHVRPGDLVAVSATNLQGVYLPRAVRHLMDRLREREPLARVGTSIFVYRADFHWLLRPAFAEELYWLPQAIESYRECLHDDPEHRGQAQEFLDNALARPRQAAPGGAATPGADAPEADAVAPADGLR